MRKTVGSERETESSAGASGELDHELQAFLRARLESAREAALRRLELVEPPAPAAPGAESTDQPAQLAIDTARDVQRILHSELHDAIEPIVDAIDRLDSGTFGRCAECGEPIGEARLLALPYASRCLLCQEERDRGTR